MSESNDPHGNAARTDPGEARPAGGLWRLKYLVVAIAAGILVGLLAMGIADARYAARKTQFENNLKQVGLAAINFHDVHLHFPPLALDGSDGANISEPVSFLAILIPLIECSDLYDKIDMTVPWNDPANRDVYKRVLPVFISPFYDRETSADGFGGTLIVPNSRLIPEGDGPGIKLDDLIDGPTKTILAGGIDITAVPAWGDPENGRDPANGFSGGAEAFGGVPKGGSQALFADGHVEALSMKTSSGIARALATPNGGEDVPLDSY